MEQWEELIVNAGSQSISVEQLLQVVEAKGCAANIELVWGEAQAVDDYFAERDMGIQRLPF